MIELKGLINLELRNANTLELEDSINITNNITQGVKYIMSNINTNYSPSDLMNFTISKGVVITNKKFVTGVNAITNFRDIYQKADTILSSTFYTGTPDYWEVKARFNAPASIRTINTIGLSNLGSGVPVNGDQIFACALLSTPCTQTTSQVLDITYRVQFFYNLSSSTNNILVSDLLGMQISKWLSSANSDRFLRAIQYSAHKCHFAQYPYRTWGPKTYTDATYSIPSITTNRLKFSISWTISNAIGRIIQSFCIGSNLTTTVSGSSIFSQFDPSFQYKPVQPIFGHNSSASLPFLDVSYLASSQGAITVNGSTWTDPDWPEFYRIDITKSGAVGTSNYFFRKRNIFGFNGNTYYNGANNGGFGYALDFSNSRPDVTWTAPNTSVPCTTLTGMHGSLKISTLCSRFEEYDSKTLILFDDTGITLQDQTNGSAVILDSTTTPQLLVSSITQVEVDNNHNVWVACKVNGLYLIQNILTTPIITKVNSNPTYGVTYGYNRIWTLNNQGLFYSTNNGSSWNQSSITFIGITDSNWSNVITIRADRNSTTHNLGILYKAGVNNRIVWWSPTTSAIAAAAINVLADDSVPVYRSFLCSRYGNMWVCLTSAGAGGNYSNILVFNTTTYKQLNSNVGYPSQWAVCFAYDYYGSPKVISAGGYNTYVKTISLYDNRYHYGSIDYGMICNSISSSNNSSTVVLRPLLCFETNKSNNLILGSHTAANVIAQKIVSLTPDNTANNNYSVTYATYLASTQPYLVANDPLNGRYSLFEELAWKKYLWNGSNWVVNAYQKAYDSSSYLNSADRHNFDPESYYFTGRSLIDASSSFTSNLVNNIATFVLTIGSDGKLNSNTSAQETVSTLLSLEDNTNSLRLLWNDGSGNISLQYGNTTLTTTILTTTPAVTSTLYRIVLIVNNTSVSVYSNNVQIGTTLTLGSAFNWTNTSSNLKVFIGSQVYDRALHTTSIAPYGFFKGTMFNIQFWNIAWNVTDINNDYFNISSVINSENITNLIARFQLNETIIETKPTHSTTDILLNGLTNNFSNYATDPTLSFTNTDYYTFGVVDGILKDNAISFNHEFSTYLYRNVNNSFNEFTVPGTNLSTIPNTSTVIITPVFWNKALMSGVLGLNPGHFAATGVSTNGSVSAAGSTFGFGSVQYLSDDGYLEWQFNSETEIDSWVALTSDVTNSVTQATFQYAIHGVSANVFEIKESGTVKLASQSYVVGDVFKIQRTGTVITYYKNGTLIYTSLISSSGILYGKFGNLTAATAPPCGVINAKMSWRIPAGVMFAGNTISQSGAFNSKFIALETDTPQVISLSLNGSSISSTNIIISNTVLGSMTAPQQGQVVVNRDAGLLYFNTADAGKTVTGSLTMIFDN